MDYTHLYPDNVISLFKWDKFCSISEEIFKLRIKDKASKTLLHDMIRQRNTINTGKAEKCLENSLIRVYIRNNAFYYKKTCDYFVCFR